MQQFNAAVPGHTRGGGTHFPLHPLCTAIILFQRAKQKRTRNATRQLPYSTPKSVQRLGSTSGSPIQVLLNLHDPLGTARRAPTDLSIRRNHVGLPLRNLDISTIIAFPVFSTLKQGVAGVRERLLSKARQTSLRTSAGRGVAEDACLSRLQPRGNPRSEVPPPEQ